MLVLIPVRSLLEGFLKTGIGASNLRKLEGGDIQLSEAPEIDPFVKSVNRKSSISIASQNSKSSRHNFRGELPPPLTLGTFRPPLSQSPLFSLSTSSVLKSFSHGSRYFMHHWCWGEAQSVCGNFPVWWWWCSIKFRLQDKIREAAPLRKIPLV